MNDLLYERFPQIAPYSERGSYKLQLTEFYADQKAPLRIMHLRRVAEAVIADFDRLYGTAEENEPFDLGAAAFFHEQITCYTLMHGSRLVTPAAAKVVGHALDGLAWEMARVCHVRELRYGMESPWTKERAIERGKYAMVPNGPGCSFVVVWSRKHEEYHFIFSRGAADEEACALMEGLDARLVTGFYYDMETRAWTETEDRDEIARIAPQIYLKHHLLLLDRAVGIVSRYDKPRIMLKEAA